MKDIAQKLIMQYYEQLQDLNYAISLRPQGERFPTSKEAVIMQKILACIKALRKEMLLTDEEQTTEATTTLSSKTAISKEVSVYTIPSANKKTGRISKKARKHAYAPQVRP
ncbi:MAG: hypothetical protein WCG87_12125 [Bacteroidota bacterium]